jgi:RNA polymerase sigma-70 factor (ECF subfamily)
MNFKNLQKSDLISEAFTMYKDVLEGYINRRIKDKDKSKDILQDVFLKLLEYKDMLCADSLKSFIFTIAQNKIVDYLRREQKKSAIQSYLFDIQESNIYLHIEKEISEKEILTKEEKIIEAMPRQRSLVYKMSRFEEKSLDEIAFTMNLSKRTIESHLFLARREIRESIRRII